MTSLKGQVSLRHRMRTKGFTFPVPLILDVA